MFHGCITFWSAIVSGEMGVSASFTIDFSLIPIFLNLKKWASKEKEQFQQGTVHLEMSKCFWIVSLESVCVEYLSDYRMS